MKSLLLLPTLLVALWSPALYAQPSATVHGAVTDESGAVIPGAKVTVSNTAGPVKSVTATDDGNYSIVGLQPGKYTLQATSPGLQQIKPATIDLSTSPNTTANLQLTVAAEKQEVTVQENPGPSISVDPSQNAGALVLRGADLQALSDDPDDLQADLQALAGPSAGPSGGQIYIDGFTGGTLPSKDSIREIRINQNPFSPEYDKLGYGRIEILTKPGTDKLHGNINADIGDDIWDARNPYAAKKAPFLQRNFGGSLSGALGKKASFFLDVQDRDIDNGNIINGFNVSPSTFAVAPFNSVFVAPQNRFRISPRLDYQLSKNNTLTVRYGYTRNDLDNQGVGNLSLLTAGYHALNTDHTVQLIETAVLSTKMINETHFQLYHTQSDELSNSPLPGLNVAGAFSGGGAQVGTYSDTENHYELQNYTTYSGGAHTWKFGVRVRAVTINNFSPQNFGGTYNFNGAYAPILNADNEPIAPGVACDQTDPNPADCALLTSIQVYSRTLALQQMGLNPAMIQALGGGPAQFTISQGTPLVNVNMVDVGAFVGDDWRVKPNLTLSLGLRFETQTDIHDWHDWAPRIGFAWAPGQSKNNPRPKTVLRGGFGIFYDRVSEQNIETAERYNGILQQQYVITQSAANPIPFLPTVAGVPAGLLLPSESPQTIELLDSHLHAPYILQEAFTVERQLPKNTTISENYVNSHGLHELRSQDINAPELGSYSGPGTGIYPLQSRYGEDPVLLMESAGLFNQWQLITNVRSQLNKRISLNGFYMYGRAYSNTDGVNTLPASPYSMAGEYGPSALDQRNRGFIGGTITGPWALLFAPFITMNTGAPFNITTGTDPFGTTLFNERPGISPTPTKYLFDGLYLDPNPIAADGTIKPGETLLPRNFGRSPGNISVNLRIAKTFGFGGSRESSARNNNNQNGGGGQGGGNFGGGGGRGPGGGGPGGGPGGGFAGGPGGGGPGGFFRGLNGGGSTGQRYNLTISVQARNLLNHVNPGPINGIVSSPLFDESNTLAGGFGAFAQSGLNRRIDLQARFTF
ncbi:MAG TPA: carboxypeptidase regulatory-like domain-containing protein [Bryobacteraceae bacterium]|nr:carboxypeptidase regulatory-like domain-containing protein [Bryobacteraceae bacterium]